MLLLLSLLLLDSDSGVSLLDISETAALLQELVASEALQPDTAQTLRYKYMGKCIDIAFQ